MQHAFDRRHEIQFRATEAQATHCLCCHLLHILRPAKVQEYAAYDREIFVRALAEKVGIYYCPVCKTTESDSARHSLMSPACVIPAQVKTAMGVH